MRKVVISGGPHTGKTTLIERLRDKHPELVYIPEPATLVIHSERLKENKNQDYQGTFPWNNYSKFGPKVISKSLELEAEILTSTDLVVLDRSLIDTVAYARLNNCERLLSDLYRHIRDANYQRVFLCDFVGEYQKSNIRSESSEEARITHHAIRKAYEESEIYIVELPSVPVDERIKIFEESIGL